MKDDRLEKMAKTTDPQIFTDAVFPKAFDNVAQESYMESQEAYTSLFQDKTKWFILNVFKRLLKISF